MVEINRYEEFLNVHSLLLTATGLPESLYPQLYSKLSSETFDAGEFFQIEPCEDGRQRRVVLISDLMAKNSNVFLVDHAWTYRLPDAPKQLEEVPGLVERMASLMCVDADLHEDAEYSADSNGKKSAEEIVETEICRAKEMGSDGAKWLELEELELDDAKLLALNLPSKCPNLIALSLVGNKIKYD